LISGGSNSDSSLGLDLFSSSKLGNEFVRIAKNVTDISTDFIMDGIMLVSSYNIKSNLEMFDTRSIDNERKNKDTKKKHSLFEKTQTSSVTSARSRNLFLNCVWRFSGGN